MPGLRTSLFAACIFWVPASAAAAAPTVPRNPAVERVQQIRKRGDALLKEMDTLQQELINIQNTYQKTKRFDQSARRLEVRRKLKEGSEELRDLMREFKDLKQRVYMRQIMVTVAQLQKKGSAPGSRADIAEAMRIEGLYRNFLTYRKSTNQFLIHEEVTFQETKRAISQKRLFAIVGVLLAAAVVVGLLVAFVYGRKASPATGPITAYSTTPGMLPGPAGALSGPVGPQGELKPGDMLDENFKIEKEIGRGGMGLVYEATDLTLRRKVAIKRMKAEIARDPKELEMFLAEARMVAALKHPNLVEIHSIVRGPNQLYLVFEFVTGKALHQLLEGGKRLSHAKIKELLQQTAAGLDYAHSQKVIHRDLKPANLMLTDEGKVKLMDFGIAHQAKKTVAKLTKADAWGTPPYMAPEQELGTVSKESDLYSLGVMYYEMTVGEQPFKGPNFLEQKRRMAYTPPTKAVPELPAELDAVITRALDADPENRFHSGAEFFLAVSGVPDFEAAKG